MPQEIVVQMLALEIVVPMRGHQLGVDEPVDHHLVAAGEGVKIMLN